MMSRWPATGDQMWLFEAVPERPTELSPAQVEADDQDDACQPGFPWTGTIESPCSWTHDLNGSNLSALAGNRSTANPATVADECVADECAADEGVQRTRLIVNNVKKKSQQFSIKG